jgi:hypothetical protein
VEIRKCELEGLASRRQLDHALLRGQQPLQRVSGSCSALLALGDGALTALADMFTRSSSIRMYLPSITCSRCYRAQCVLDGAWIRAGIAGCIAWQER